MDDCFHWMFGIGCWYLVSAYFILHVPYVLHFKRLLKWQKGTMTGSEK